MIAAVHADPRLTVPAAIALGGLLLWYWVRLGRGDVPAARRRVRRLSLLVMLVSLPNFARGLSYLDPAVDSLEYAVSWTASVLFMLLVIAIALADAVVTGHLHRRRQAAEAGDQRETAPADERP